MNLYRFISRITHYRNSNMWIETDGVFTGKSEAAIIQTRMGPQTADYSAFEITYYVGEKRLHGWYSFHPLPDPDPEELAGNKIRIRYRKRKPFIF